MGKRSAGRKTKMKVAFIEQESLLGGVEYSTFRVAKALDKGKFEPVIICPEEGDLPYLARQAGLDVRIVPRPKFSSVSILWSGRYLANPLGFIFTAINVFRSAQIMRRDLYLNRADIVITKGLLAHFYGGMASSMLNIPCIWYIQEEVDKKRGAGLYRYILLKSAQRFPAKIVVDAVALLEQFADAPKLREIISVVYNGIDVDQFKPFSAQEQQDARRNLGIPPKAVVIGQAGRIIPLKGQATLLEAFARLVNEFPDIHLIFVGAPLFGSQDYEKKLRSQTVQLKLAERIHFSGFIPDVRLGLAALDIFVHASIETDSPLSVMEAMACGLPMIVSGVRGTVEMVDSGVNALVFEPGNSNALAFALKKLLKSPKTQKELGERARTAALEKYSLQTSVAQLQTLMEKVYGS
jgi:glycosyltransferase involved in cell wall biosynthesis